MAGIQTTTRWQDTQKMKLSQADEILRAPHTDEINKYGPSYIQWKIDTSFEEPQKVKINNINVTYNLYRYSFLQVPQGANQDDSLTSFVSGWVIIYESNNSLHYIINRHSNAKTYLRKILKYTGKNELRQESTYAYGDLFVWLISKVYQQDNVLEGIAEGAQNITVDSILAFKGDTEDALNKVSASGESVTNILSTLSFLVESQRLKQLTFKAICGSDSTALTLMLTTSNTVGVNISEYLATQEDNVNRDDLIARLMLYIYLELLPTILQTYNGELAAGQWGKDSCVHFLQDVAHALADKVDARIDDLKKNPDQLTFNSADKENEEAEDDQMKMDLRECGSFSVNTE